jgi:hypothetical protein
MLDSIEALKAEVAALWQEASHATGGGEGLAAMRDVRNAQARLAAAYVAAADAASDPAVQRTHLEEARVAMVEVLIDFHGPDHSQLVAPLRAVLGRLGAAEYAHHREIAAAWLGIAEHRVKYGWPVEGRELARRIGALLDGVAGADDVRARAGEVATGSC